MRSKDVNSFFSKNHVLIYLFDIKITQFLVLTYYTYDSYSKTGTIYFKFIEFYDLKNYLIYIIAILKIKNNFKIFFNCHLELFQL